MLGVPCAEYATSLVNLTFVGRYEEVSSSQLLILAEICYTDGITLRMGIVVIAVAMARFTYPERQFTSNQ